MDLLKSTLQRANTALPCINGVKVIENQSGNNPPPPPIIVNGVSSSSSSTTSLDVIQEEPIQIEPVKTDIYYHPKEPKPDFDSDPKSEFDKFQKIQPQIEFQRPGIRGFKEEKVEMAMQIVLFDGFDSNGKIWDKVQKATSIGSKSFTLLSNGAVINASDEVKVSYGPVVGEVTETSAIVLIETFSESGKTMNLECRLFDKSKNSPKPVKVIEKANITKTPQSFAFTKLTPDTKYECWFSTSPSPTLASFKTKKKDMEKFRFIALSCDKPARLLMGQLNPWKSIHKVVKTGRIDMVLHLGDQIYPDGEDIEHADRIFQEMYDDMNDEKKEDMIYRGKELWRAKYRSTFSKPYKKEISAMVSNVTIWSDNDVANDFTTMKNKSGGQAYHPMFIQCGMEVYREFQRRLWDVDAPGAFKEDEEVKEWHSHVYGDGKVGIFVFDLRGNRIKPDGVQMAENNLLSDAQWADFEKFLKIPTLRAVILGSETPFLGDTPEATIKTVKKVPALDFLRDHWAYNEKELLKLTEMSFKWKEEGDGFRDIIWVGGDIHCGCTSILTDQESGLQINHYVTSPITNHVCQFFPKLNGQLNERYHYSHLPLGEMFRNYLDVDIFFDEDSTMIQAKLVPISCDIFKNTEYKKY